MKLWTDSVDSSVWVALVNTPEGGLHKCETEKYNFLRNSSLQSKRDENLALGVVSVRGLALCRMPMDTFDLEHVKFIFESFSPLL